MRYANCIVAIGLTLGAATAFAQQLPSLSNRAPEGVSSSGEVAESLACPCTDGLPEGEANCGLPTDTVNGGCNSMPNVFSSISPGDTYCGTAEWNTTVPSFRDTDWYEYTVTGTQTLRWEVEAEFPAQLAVVSGPTCVSATIIASDFTTGCGDVGGIQLRLAPGTYWFFVAPDFTGPPVACGAQYTANLILVPEAVPAVSAAGLIGIAIMLAVVGSAVLFLRRHRPRAAIL